jgi:hypothetical protein
MDFTNASKVYRKSGGSPSIAFAVPNHKSRVSHSTRNRKTTTNPHQPHIHESKSPLILSYAIANYDL